MVSSSGICIKVKRALCVWGKGFEKYPISSRTIDHNQSANIGDLLKSPLSNKLLKKLEG